MEYPSTPQKQTAAPASIAQLPTPAKTLPKNITIRILSRKGEDMSLKSPQCTTDIAPINILGRRQARHQKKLEEHQKQREEAFRSHFPKWKTYDELEKKASRNGKSIVDDYLDSFPDPKERSRKVRNLISNMWGPDERDEKNFNPFKDDGGSGAEQDVTKAEEDEKAREHDGEKGKAVAKVEDDADDEADDEHAGQRELQQWLYEDDPLHYGMTLDGKIQTLEDDIADFVEPGVPKIGDPGIETQADLDIITALRAKLQYKKDCIERARATANDDGKNLFEYGYKAVGNKSPTWCQYRPSGPGSYYKVPGNSPYNYALSPSSPGGVYPTSGCKDEPPRVFFPTEDEADSYQDFYTGVPRAEFDGLGPARYVPPEPTSTNSAPQQLQQEQAGPPIVSPITAETPTKSQKQLPAKRPRGRPPGSGGGAGGKKKKTGRKGRGKKRKHGSDDDDDDDFRLEADDDDSDAGAEPGSKRLRASVRSGRQLSNSAGKYVSYDGAYEADEEDNSDHGAGAGAGAVATAAPAPAPTPTPEQQGTVRAGFGVFGQWAGGWA